MPGLRLSTFQSRRDSRRDSPAEPKPDAHFTDDEHAAVMRAVRRAIDEDHSPMAPRLAPLRSALARLDPASAPKPNRTATAVADQTQRREQAGQGEAVILSSI